MGNLLSKQPPPAVERRVEGSSEEKTWSEKPSRPVKKMGPGLKADFMFADGWRNLNHGSYGSVPKAVQSKYQAYQDENEARPDRFIRFELAGKIDESRAAVAKVVNAPTNTVVFVSNATEGVNTIFKNLTWSDDNKDVVITFSTVYESCANVVEYLVDYYGAKVTHRQIDIRYPIEDDAILDRFKSEVSKVHSEGKRVRVAMCDIVSSSPGVVFPWEAMCAVCKELGVLSMVDGAQGIGMLHIDLKAADPDFLVTNCHKWLHVPRGCAVLYVPKRNQHLVPTSLSTSHGYNPGQDIRAPGFLASAGRSYFENLFESVGTDDYSSYISVKDALAWRRDVLGGEDKIIDYLWNLNKKGSQFVADRLGTKVLENSKGTLRNCAMANVALPIWIDRKGDGAGENDVVVPGYEVGRVFGWMQSIMTYEYQTYIPVHLNQGRFWVRISAQVYLGMEDYEYAADMLKLICWNAGQGHYRASKEQ